MPEPPQLFAGSTLPLLAAAALRHPPRALCPRGASRSRSPQIFSSAQAPPTASGIHRDPALPHWNASDHFPTALPVGTLWKEREGGLLFFFLFFFCGPAPGPDATPPLAPAGANQRPDGSWSKEEGSKKRCPCEEKTGYDRGGGCRGRGQRYVKPHGADPLPSLPALLKTYPPEWEGGREEWRRLGCSRAFSGKPVAAVQAEGETTLQRIGAAGSYAWRRKEGREN